MANQHNFQQSHGFRAPLGDGGMRQNQGRGGYKGNFYNRPVSVRPSVGTHPMFPPEGQHRQYFNPNRPFFSPPRVPHQNFGEFRPPRHPRITHGNMNNRFNMQGKNTSYDRQWKGQKHNFQVSILGCSVTFFAKTLDYQFNPSISNVFLS